MSLLSLILYISLQILFITLAVISSIYVGYCQIGVSKKLGASMTAIEVINGRLSTPIFGIDAGFDRPKRTLFPWESTYRGVLAYVLHSFTHIRFG